MSDGNDGGHARIPEPDLQRFAARETDERLSVLIELEAEPPELLIGERTWGESSPRALAISGRDDHAITDRLARLGKTVAGIVGTEPVCLEIAEALVADVTAAQLRRIAQLPEVGCIRLNRRHQQR